MIKKIEHFWKGLSHDKTQISALPPEQYGERFYRFVKDITMSAEEARRRELEREAAEAEAEVEAAREEEEEEEAPEEAPRGICPLGSHHGRPHVPPMPTHQPPRPPGRVPHGEKPEERGNESLDLLPVVDEAAEGSEKRPKTPAKDRPVTPRMAAGAGAAGRSGKPESADSGYGGNGAPEEVLRGKSSRVSLEKELPPLPGEAR